MVLLTSPLAKKRQMVVEHPSQFEAAFKRTTAVVDEPGMFCVEGVDKATKMDTTWRCRAGSEANARIKAELEGIIVTRITRE